MNEQKLRKIWIEEENSAHIHGWDFSHIHGRYEEEKDLPWDYEKTVKKYLKDTMDILDYDTGGGEFLLSLSHPLSRTSATEGYEPNIAVCRKTLSPLGIDFRECRDPSAVPFDSDAFDMILNRHGDFDAAELYRLLKKEGLFITEQVGCDNDRDLVEMVLPDIPKPFPKLYLSRQKKEFQEAGFHIIDAQEAYRPIRFFDVGAFVWFAHIIEWEFPCFTVDRCFSSLLIMQKQIEEKGFIEGTIHRFLLVAQK